MEEISSLVTAYGLRGLQAEEINILKLNAEASNGSIDAVFNMAICYRDGIKVVQDLKKSFDLLKQLSDIGCDKDALYLVAQYYGFGYGVEQDLDEYGRLLKKYVDNYGETLEDDDDVYYWAIQLEDSDIQKAIDMYTQLAENDHMNAKARLGYLYFENETIRNYTKAFEWTLEAANDGHRQAQRNLGCFYQDGKGVSKDDAKAAYWFEKAAEQGHDDAQNHLGVLYYNGKGVEQDYQKACYWFEKAAEQGNADAQNNLGSLYQDGKGVEQDYQKACYWFEKAAEQKHLIAMNCLSLLYIQGQGIPQDLEKGLKLAECAMERGSADASINLAMVYLLKHEDEKAKMYLKKGVEQGSASAQVMLQKINSLL